MDVFYEQFLDKDYGKLEYYLNYSRKFMLIFSILSSVVFNIFVALGGLLIYLILCLVARKMLIEYEYELTENSLVISKIMDKKKRKVVGEFNVDELIKVSRNKESYHYDKLIDTTLNDEFNCLNNYYLYTKKNDKIIAYKVAFDRKLDNLCKKINPVMFSLCKGE